MCLVSSRYQPSNFTKEKEDETEFIVCGRVFASELAIPTAGNTNMSVNVPLQGVTVTVDGMEENMRAMTDQFGNFRLTNAPAGPFFVHIDGRTVTNYPAGIPELLT